MALSDLLQVPTVPHSDEDGPRPQSTGTDSTSDADSDTSSKGQFRYFIHFPMGGKVLSDVSDEELPPILQDDLENDQLTVYRSKSECPESGIVLLVRLPKEDVGEARKIARVAVRDLGRLYAPREVESSDFSGGADVNVVAVPGIEEVPGIVVEDADEE